MSEFDGHKAGFLAHKIAQACADGDPPTWTGAERDTLSDYLDQGTGEISAKLRARVLHSEINRSFDTIRRDQK